MTGSGAAGRCFSTQNEWSLINPILNMPVNSRSQPGFCGLWHRYHGQQVQAISAAAGSPLACPSVQLALPLGRNGNHTSAHGLSEQLCPSSPGDSLTPSMGESLAHRPRWGSQNSLCHSLASTLPPFPLPGQAGHCRLGPMHTLLWDQSGAGCKPLSRRCPFVPLRTVP